jgi:hypothetical protein
MTATLPLWIKQHRTVPTSPSIDRECQVRRISANVGIELLGIVGGGQIGAVVEFIDQVRDQLLGRGPIDADTIHEHIIQEAHHWVEDRYQVRLVTSLGREATEQRLGALLWSAHSALPAQPSHAVLLRCLCAISAVEAAACLGISRTSLATQLNRAARRVRAFRLELKPAVPQANRFGLKLAEQRLRTLHRHGTRPGTPVHLAQAVADWMAFVRSCRGRKTA